MTSLFALLLLSPGDEPPIRIMSGTIEAIDDESMTLLAGGKSRTFRLQPKMEIKLDGGFGRVHEAKVGDSATVTYETATEKAVKISVSSASAAKRKADPRTVEEKKAEAEARKQKKAEKDREEEEAAAERKKKAAERKAAKKKEEQKQRQNALEAKFGPREPPPPNPADDPDRDHIGPFESSWGKIDVTLTQSAPWEITFIFQTPRRTNIKSQDEVKLWIGKLPALRATSITGEGSTPTRARSGPTRLTQPPGKTFPLLSQPPSLKPPGSGLSKSPFKKPGAGLTKPPGMTPPRDSLDPFGRRAEQARRDAKDRLDKERREEMRGPEIGATGKPFTATFLLPALPPPNVFDRIEMQVGDWRFTIDKVQTPGALAEFQRLFREAQERR